VISSPAKYRDIKQELIAEIHGTSIWPVVVTVDGNINIREKSDFVDTDGSYIILIPDGNISTFRAQFIGLAANKFRYTRLWDSEARFVVAGANEFSMLQQMEIFNFLSKFRIYNCIIVSQEHYLIGDKYSGPINVKDIDKFMKLVVYSWFPYRSSDRCTEVNDITILDSWVISAQGHFTKNTDLFPRKISNNLNGCPMKAFVRDGKNYFTTIYVQHKFSNGGVREYIMGLEYDLLNVVLQQMNMELVLIHRPNVFELSAETTSKLIGDMVAKEMYIALGGLGTNILSVPYFDTTNPYYTMSVRWYVPCSVKYPRWSSIFRILSVELWLVLITSIVIAAISTTLVGRYSCTPEWQRYKTLTSSLTNLWAVILGVPVSTMPRTPSVRVLFLGWVCFSVAFYTVFRAFLISFLVDSGYKTPIQRMDEMFASGIKLAYPPEYSFIIENGDETELSNVQRNLGNCPSYDVCVNWAKYHKNVSILMVDRLAEVKFLGENSEPLVCRLDDGIVYSYGQAMVMFHGDPLMRRVNEIIARVVEAGLYDLWISVYSQKYKLLSRKIGIVHPLDGYYSFNLYHMQPAFYLLLIGWCLSALCFMFELVYSCVLNKRM